MGGKKDTQQERSVLHSRLTAKLNDTQRQLCEYTERIKQCETTIRECREQLEEGRDKQHFHWLVPTLMLAAGGLLLSAVRLGVLSKCCHIAAVIAFFRWLADFIYSLKKYGRIVKRLQHNISESDQLSERTSALRLETVELRQRLEQLEREIDN